MDRFPLDLWISNNAWTPCPLREDCRKSLLMLKTSNESRRWIVLGTTSTESRSMNASNYFGCRDWHSGGFLQGTSHDHREARYSTYYLRAADSAKIRPEVKHELRAGFRVTIGHIAPECI